MVFHDLLKDFPSPILENAFIGVYSSGRISPASYPVGDYSAEAVATRQCMNDPSTVSVVPAVTRRLLESRKTPEGG
jgi:hypothetical protein